MPPSSCDSLLARFCVFAFLYDLVFAYPIYAVLFQERGLSVLEISLLLLWWALSAGLFEVPSGALADHWSRRKLLIIAPLIKCMCFIVWCFAGGSFFLFALGFTFWGLGSSFVSGTLEAMLYDTLSHFGRADQYEKACGRLRMCKHAARAIACLAGGFIARYSMEWALLLSVIPLALAAATALTMQEPPHERPSGPTHYFTHFRNAWGEFRTNGAFRYVLIYQVLTIGVMGEIDEYDPLYFTMVGVPVQFLGWIDVMRGALESVGNMAAHRLKHLAFVETAAPLITGSCLLLAGIFPSKAMIAAILLGYFIIAPVEVLIEGRMQNAMRTASRATVLSGASLFGMMTALPQMALFGLVARRWGLGAGYILFALMLLGVSLWVPLRKARGKADEGRNAAVQPTIRPIGKSPTLEE